MGRREDVDNSIWADDDFLALSANARYLYLWSFTNPHCNMAGLYKIARRVMQLETGLTAKQLDSALAELAAVGMVLVHDGVLWVKSRIKYLRTRSTTIGRSIAKDLEFFEPDHPLRVALLRRYSNYPEWLSDHIGGLPVAEPNLDTPSIPHRDPIEGSPGRAGHVVKEETATSVAPAPALTPGLAGYLVPVADALRRVAEGKPGAMVPTDAAVAKSLQDFPHRDFVPLVAEFEHYWLHGKGAGVVRKDVVATWRNWLARQPDVMRKTPATGAAPSAATAPGSAEWWRRQEQRTQAALAEAESDR